MLETFDTQRDAPYLNDLQALSNTTEMLYALGDPESSDFDATTLSDIDTRLNQGKAWAIRKDAKTIGIIWISLQEGDVPVPSLHFVVHSDGDVVHGAVKDAIRYSYCHLPYATLYSRHSADNTGVMKLDKKLGFEKDGDIYEDEQQQKWQNIALVL